MLVNTAYKGKKSNEENIIPAIRPRSPCTHDVTDNARDVRSSTFEPSKADAEQDTSLPKTSGCGRDQGPEKPCGGPGIGRAEDYLTPRTIPVILSAIPSANITEKDVECSLQRFGFWEQQYTWLAKSSGQGKNGPPRMRLVSEAVAAFGCNPAMLFATKHFEALKKEGALEVPDSGWCFYDPIQDFARMGIDTELIPNPQRPDFTCPWRVSELNRHYRL
ncbi:Phosphoinositide 3-phosphatase [Symbiodinium microadriaticum]|uniref:Phosphoinositide 3-phosphatase n=1 Tax=Symbiodinium microadriaticum TaxID=2951 RepID=A0A1Q9D619_SYMMI|nr:Phosphoinositide 3-phosphatase [Symbiodinium microadriaticum]